MNFEAIGSKLSAKTALEFGNKVAWKNNKNDINPANLGLKLAKQNEFSLFATKKISFWENTIKILIAIFT